MGRRAAIRALAFIGVLLSFGTTRAETASTTAETILGACRDVAAMPEPFEDRIGLKVLVTRFVGEGEAETARRFGAQVGYRIGNELPRYFRERIAAAGGEDAGVSLAELQVRYVGCVVDSHDEARRIGQKWGAELVIWGVAVVSGGGGKRPVKAAGHVEQIVRVENSKVGDIKPVINVEEARFQGSFSTSLTAEDWPTLQADGGKAGLVSRPSQVEQLRFPRLASNEPTALFDFVLGLYAFRTERFGVASKFFVRASKAVYFDPGNAAAIYQMTGRAYRSSGDFAHASEAFSEMGKRCPPRKMACRMAAQTDLGTVAFAQGRFQQAGDYYKEALRLGRSAGDEGLEVQLNLATNRGEQGDTEGAIKELEALFVRFKEASRIDLAAIALGNSAQLRQARGETAEALQRYQEILALCQARGDQLGEGRTQNNIALASAGLGDIPRALDAYEAALAIFRQIGAADDRAKVLANVSGLNRQSGRTAVADEQLAEALKLFVASGNAIGESVVLADQALPLYQAADFDAALRLARRSVAAAERTGAPIAIAASSEALAQVRMAQGFFDEANALLQAALTTVSGRGLTDKEAHIYFSLGELASLRGDLPAALALYDKAIKLQRQGGDVDGLVIYLESRANMLGQLKQPDDARAACQEALPLARKIRSVPMTARILFRLARLDLDEARLDEARREGRECTELLAGGLDVANEGLCRAVLAEVEGLAGNGTAALAEARAALPLLAKADLVVQQAVRMLLAGLTAQQGDRLRAQKPLTEAVDAAARATYRDAIRDYRKAAEVFNSQSLPQPAGLARAQAFSVALRAGLTPEATAVLADMRRLGMGRLESEVEHARLAAMGIPFTDAKGTARSTAALAAYDRLAALSAQPSPDGLEHRMV